MSRVSVLSRTALVAVVVTVAAFASAVTFAAAPHTARAEADTAIVGQAGLFVPNVGRLLDTRDGTGGFSTPMSANTVRTVAATGHAGIPSTGVSALALTLTVPGAAASGTVTVAPGDVTPNQIAASIAFTAGDSVSNTSLVALHSDGNLRLVANTAVNLIVDVQGYFTSGSSTAAGGFVPVNATRIVTPTQVGNNSSIDVQVTGNAGVPSSATSVYANVTVSGQSGNGFLRVYPTGGTVPTVDALAFDSAVAMSQTTAVKLSSSGKFTILVPAGGPVNVSVDVQGYFTAGTGNQVFTPAQLHYYDSRQSLAGQPARPLAAGEVRKIQIAGLYGVPGGGDGLTAVALNMRTSNTGAAASGWLRAWPDDQTEPAATNISYGTSEDYRSNVAIVSPGADGMISVRNGGTGPIDLILDVEGWFSVNLPQPEVGAHPELSGDRAGAKSISHSLTDRSKLVFSPVTGNLLATGQLLHVAGIDQDTTINWRYNSLNDNRPTLNVGYKEAALVSNGDSSLTYTAPDGGGYTFPQVDATHWGTWTTPAGINARIALQSSGVYDLTFYPSGTVLEFTADGAGTLRLTSSRDKYQTDTTATPPNKTNEIDYDYGTGNKQLVSMTDTRGKTIHFAYTDNLNPTQPSLITDDALGRTISIVYGASGAMNTITDATGVQTKFGYASSGLLTSITSGIDPSVPGSGTQTMMSYGSDGKATGWTYAAGTSDASTWSAQYPSAIQTKVTDPNQHVATYDLKAGTVEYLTDANRNKTTTEFDQHDNGISTATQLGNTSTMEWGNTTNGGTNHNNMLSKATSPASGNSGTAGTVSFNYPATAGGDITDYQATSATDTQNNTTTPIYNSRHDISSVITPVNADGTSAGGTLKSRRQGDQDHTDCHAYTGELCSSSNGNGATTSYTYDAIGRVTVLTQPSPLKTVTFTYDGANRVVTSMTTDRGNKAYYSYDADDRLTQVSYSSATDCPAATCVSYSYDAFGNKVSRTAATGTTGYSYDRLNRPTAKTFNGASVSTVTWDSASNLRTFTDAAGTVTYTYDPGNRLIYLAQPGGSCPSSAATPVSPNANKCTQFTYTGDDQREWVYYPNGQRIHLQYSHAGQITKIDAVNNGGGVLASRAYTYSKGGNDAGLRDTTVDAVAGTTTSYSYDGMSRLTAASTGADAWSYSYDKAGNRLTSAKTGQASTYAAYNDADELCWTGAGSGTCTAPPSGASMFGYDGSGNQTTAGSDATAVNVFDQVTSIQTAGVTTAFTYNDTDNTERNTAAGTNFVNGTLGLTAQTAGGSTVEFTRDPGGNLIAMTTSAGSSYYTTDELGSVILMTGSSQTAMASYSYDPYGRITASSGSQASANPWRYTGGYYDTQTGLTKLGARYYNPVTGRFTQPDPSRQEQNTYAYASDNPINNTDPTGLSVLDNVLTYTGFALDGAGLALGFFAAAPALVTGVALVGITVGGLAAACSLTNDENGCTGAGG